jgi:hypothetical protein
MTGTVPRINLTYRGQYGHTGLSSPEVVGPFFFYVHGCTRTNEWAVSLWYITVMTIVLGLMTGVTPNVLRTHFGGLMARQSLLIPIGPYCVDPVRDKS